jgi:hypothetical protein
MATLEPEPTQHSKPTLSGQTPDKEVKISHLFIHDRGYTEHHPSCLQTTKTSDYLAQQKRFVSSPQSVQILPAVSTGFKCQYNGQNVFDRIFRDMPPPWGHRDKKYHNRDIKPKLWDIKETNQM